MADKKFTLTFDVEGNLAPIKGAVKDFQSTIKSANFQIPVGIQGNIDKIITKLNAEIAEFESLTSQGFSNMADIGKAEKSFTKITSLMRQLSSQGEQIKGLDPKKFLPKEILDRTTKLEKAFNKLGDIKINTKKIDAQTEAVKKQKEEVEELKTKYEALAAENKTAGTRKGNLSSSIKSKEKELEAIQQQMKALEQVKGGKSSAEYSRLNAEFKALSKTISAQKQEYTSLDTTINKNKTTMSGLKVQLDSASSSLEQMEESLRQLQASANVNEDLENLRKELAQLKNVNIDEIPSDLDEIKRIISSLDDDQIKTIKNSLEGMGKAADDLAPSLEKTSKELEKTGEEGKELTRVGQEIENLKGQVLDFFSITNTIQIFKNAVRDAFDTVKELDAVMTETAVVTDFSIGDMWDKLPEYAEQANKLGASIKNLYSANTLYYQQGLNSQQAMSVGVETMKMARIANMDAAEATEAMTAALRGFNMEINETSAGRINDVYSELAAITASDTEQIATAMSKTASIAASANMKFETTAALLAQIIETTQEAPETAGTAMKTIIARFTEVKELFSEGILTGEDSEGEEININKIDAALKSVGISLKDFLNGSKGIDDIFLELASKWNGLDLATQRYIATTAAGSRQQSRFIAMMSNYDRTMELVTAANNSAGASQKQFNKTLESLDAKLQRLKNAWDTFVMGLANNELIKVGVDLLTKFLETINDLTDDLGDTVGSIAKLGITIAGLNIGKSIFNNIFDIKPLENSIGKVKGISQTISTAFRKIGITSETELTQKIDIARNSITGLSGNLTIAGVACGAFAQYLKAIGMEDFAEILEIVGSSLVIVGNGFNLVNSVAQNLGLTIGQLGTKFLSVLGPALPTILGIGAALAAIVVVLKKIYDTSAAGQLEAAQKATEEAAEAAQEAAEAYTNLKNSLDSIEGKTSALTELTRGTNEWKEAVVSLNEEILELVNTYPELAGFIENEGGVLKINYEDTKTVNGKQQSATDVLESYLKKQTTTSQNYSQKQITEKEKEIDLEYTKALKNFTNQISVIDIEKAINESDGSGDWGNPRKIIDEIALAIANNEIDPEQGQKEIEKRLEQANYQIYEYDDSFYNSLKEYGDYLISQQEAMNGLTDSVIAASMALMDFDKFSDESQKLINELNSDILREAYNSIKTDNEVKKEAVTDKDREEYAITQGYKKVTGWLGQTIYKDKDGERVSIDDAKVAEYKTNEKTNESFESFIMDLLNKFDSMNEDQQKKFSEIFSESGKELSRETLKAYGEYQNGVYSFDEGQKDSFAKSVGYDTFDNLAKDLSLSAQQLVEQLDQVFEQGGAEFIKARRNLVRNMSKYSATEKGNLDANANILTKFEETYGSWIVDSLNNVIGSLESTGDQELVTAGLEYFKVTGMEGTKEEVQELSEFIESISWEDPIQGAYQLNQEIKEGSALTKDFASVITSLDSEQFSISSQFDAFFNSETYDEIKEDLSEIFDLQGQVNKADIDELTSEYSYLNKLLKNTTTSTSALAKILNSIHDGTMEFEDLTDAVLAALSGMNSLSASTDKVVERLTNLDRGTDLGEIQDAYTTFGDDIEEWQEQGEYGNPQYEGTLDYIFGTSWDVGYEDEALIERAETLGDFVEKLGEDMWYGWERAAKGLNMYGEALDTEALAKLQQLKDEYPDFQLELNDGKLTFQVPDDWTLEETAEHLSEIYGGTKEYWEDQGGYLQNRDPNMKRTWDLADYNQTGKRIAEEEQTKIEGKKIVSEAEIETIATDFQVDYPEKDIETIKSEIKKQLEDNEVSVIDIPDEGTYIEQAKSITDQLNSLFSENQDGFAQQFYETFQGVESLDLSGLLASVQQLGLSEEITNQVVNGYAAAAQEAGKTITYEVEGQTYTMTMNPDIEGTNFVGKMNTLVEEAEAKMEQAELDSTAEVTLNQSAWNASVNSARSYVDGVLGSLKYKATVSANVSGVNESNNSQPTSNVKYGSLDWELLYNADGEPGAVKKYDSLVGEEGPELIESRDGAYLSGVGGPQVVTLQRGDTVHTAEETEEIFKRKGIPIPAYSKGVENLGSVSSSSGSSSSSSDDDEDIWENGFDKLYNLVRKIDEELHQRERIERRYEKLLENIDVSANQIISVSREELAQLQKEAMLQKKLIAERETQISDYQAENSDLTQYANVVQNDNGESVLRINWDLINSVTDSDEGDRIDDYISQLEEWTDSLEEAEEALWDIEDAVDEIKERGEEEYFNLEEAIKEALSQSYQDEIDELSKINDSINNTNSSLLDAIQKSLDKQRQDRDNQRTEDDLAEKQRRLLYLQQDTSGANAMEILQLQKEIEEGQEDYTDTLIDQKISELQDQNEDAAEQREQYITLLQAQLDQYLETGRIWNDVYDLMDEGLDKDTGLVRGSLLEDLLKSADGYKGMSEISKMEWLNETNNMIAQALAYLEIGRQLEDIGVGAGTEIEFTTSDGRVLTGTVNSDGSVLGSDGKTYNNVFQGYDGKYYAGENIADVEEPTVEGNGSYDGGGSTTISKSNPYGVASNQGNYTVRNKTQGTYMSGTGVKAIQWALDDMGYNVGSIDGIYGYATHFAVQAFQSDEGISADGDFGPDTREKMRLRGYKTGGLADFTGPAWLDGTKARPELVLNAKDTQNFIQLKDILASVMERGSTSNASTENNGDITYDIDINVESIGSDYDVEQVANKIKSMIGDNARYRNNNTVSLAR